MEQCLWIEGMVNGDGSPDYECENSMSAELTNFVQQLPVEPLEVAFVNESVFVMLLPAERTGHAYTYHYYLQYDPTAQIVSKIIVFVQSLATDLLTLIDGFSGPLYDKATQIAQEGGLETIYRAMQYIAELSDPGLMAQTRFLHTITW